MAIRLTCVCGAYLEIDEKFKGQKIPCPDCNRQLDTSPPLPPAKITSGWALASIILPLAGMFTLIGPIAGIVCGLTAARRIRQDPSIGGLEFAKAGMLLGAFFTLMSLWALAAPEFFGLDGLLRVVISKDVRSPSGLVVRSLPLNNDSRRAILTLPGRGWGQQTNKDTERGEILTLVHPWDDAHVACFSLVLDKEDDVRTRAIQRFLESQLVKSLMRGSAAPPAFPEPNQIRALEGDEKEPQNQVFEIDLTLGSLPRVFLFRVLPGYVAVGGARKNRYAVLEESLRSILDSFKVEKSE